jgi:hypothetical protein
VSFVTEVTAGHEGHDSFAARSEPPRNGEPMNDYKLGAAGALIAKWMMRSSVPSAANERAQLLTIDG